MNRSEERRWKVKSRGASWSRRLAVAKLAVQTFRLLIVFEKKLQCSFGTILFCGRANVVAWRATRAKRARLAKLRLRPIVNRFARNVPGNSSVGAANLKGDVWRKIECGSMWNVWSSLLRVIGKIILRKNYHLIYRLWVLLALCIWCWENRDLTKWTMALSQNSQSFVFMCKAFTLFLWVTVKKENYAGKGNRISEQCFTFFPAEFSYLLNAERGVNKFIRYFDAKFVL